MSQFTFNPFIENFDKISGVITGIQFIGVIRNANLNPGYPSSSPSPNQAWLVADNNGTVGGNPVSIGDIVLYTSSGWEIIGNGTFTIPIASETVYGKVRIATIAEVIQGTIDDAAITPLKLFNYLQSFEFGNALLPQFLSRLVSDGSILITDNTSEVVFSLPQLISAGNYGSENETLIIETDERGRINNISATPIFLSANQITDLSTFISNNFSSIITSNTLDVNNGNIELRPVINSGTYGDASHFPVITVDEYGRVTSVTTTSITGNPNFTEDVQDIIGNSLTSSTLNISYDDNSGYTIIEIPDTGINPGTYGSSSQIPTFVVNSQGRLVSANNVNISISATNVSDFTNAVRNVLSTSVGNTSNITLTWNPFSNQILADLTNVGTMGTYGSGSQIPVITTDSKGRVVNVSLVNINWSAGTFTSTQITDFNEAAQDAVGNILKDSSEIDFTYNDAANEITANLKPTGVTPGSYTKVTVDSKGRVTSATNLSSSDIPPHTHDGADIVSGIINVARLGINPTSTTFLRGDGQFATVTPSFGNQTPNTVFAGPSNAPSAPPVFRSLVNQDLPVSGATPGNYGSSTLIPVITVNDRGIVTAITTTPVSTPSLTWGNITGSIINQTDLMNLLNDYQLRSEKSQPGGYASLDNTGKLPLSELTIHTHGVGDILGLTALLDLKANLSHTHVSTDITDFEEAVQDTVANTLVAGQGIAISYNDFANEILIENTQNSLSVEDVQDAVASLFTSGTHQGITFIYDDAGNKINTSVTLNLQEVTDNGNQTSNTIIVENTNFSLRIQPGQITIDNVSSIPSASWIGLSIEGLRIIDDNMNILDVMSDRICYQDKDFQLIFPNPFVDTAPIIQYLQGKSGTIALLSDIPSSVLQFSDFTEAVQDTVASTLIAGTGINLVYNDTANTLTISCSITGLTDAILQHGNSFGEDVVIGSNDNYSLSFETNNQIRITINEIGEIGINDIPESNTSFFLKGIGNTNDKVFKITNNTSSSRIEYKNNQDLVLQNISNIEILNDNTTSIYNFLINGQYLFFEYDTTHYSNTSNEIREKIKTNYYKKEVVLDDTYNPSYFEEKVDSKYINILLSNPDGYINTYLTPYYLNIRLKGSESSQIRMTSDVEQAMIDITNSYGSNNISMYKPAASTSSLSFYSYEGTPNNSMDVIGPHVVSNIKAFTFKDDFKEIIDIELSVFDVSSSDVGGTIIIRTKELGGNIEPRFSIYSNGITSIQKTLVVGEMYNITPSFTNAQLEVISSSKGFLPPRLSTTQRNSVSWSSSDEGMIIFNTTTKKLQCWNGTSWNDLF